jgi:hypothetical protein
VTSDSAERVQSPGTACWICGRPAVCGQKLPGRRRKVLGLCQAHADAMFGAQDPPWQRMDDVTQREIFEDWLRAITIMVHGGHRPPEELLAEIGAVNDVSTHSVTLVTQLLPGEARDLKEAQRAQNRLRSRETMAHAAVTLTLLRWCATASGQTPSDILQRLALTLDTLLDQSGAPGEQGPA